jgi:hypothetical protein
VKERDHFPSIRLATAGGISLLLILWAGFWDENSWRHFIFTQRAIDGDALLSLPVTVGFAFDFDNSYPRFLARPEV